ncbi:hypothetical protein, partial [Parabacteroides merdae]|uniref:hypothetical protein n=1 Tax=Parabacteroides merdae TaxID=46503 RepID=UPI0039B614A5
FAFCFSPRLYEIIQTLIVSQQLLSRKGLNTFRSHGFAILSQNRYYLMSNTNILSIDKILFTRFVSCWRI